MSRETANLVEIWKNRNTVLVEDHFTHDDHSKIFFAKYAGAEDKRPLLIVTGLAQTYWQWIELAIDLRKQGYDGSIYLLDNRGQGRSDRLIAKQKKTAHIESFSQYVEDLDHLMKKIRTEQFPKVNALGHSMGAAIVTLAHLKDSELFEKWMAVSPMYSIRRRGLLRFADNSSLLLLARIKKIFTGQVQLGKDLNTYSEARAHFRERVLAETSTEITAVTLDWIVAALLATEQIEKQARSTRAENAHIVTGQDDLVVDNEIAKRVTYAMGAKYCEIPNAQHMLFEEGDPARQNLLRTVSEFFSL